MRTPHTENSLLFLHPELEKEWDYDKNYPLRPEGVFAHSPRKAWFKCEKGHRYDAVINRRSKGDGCPYCSGHRVCKDNCLATVNPKLAEEWDYEKNYPLTPEDVFSGSRKTVGWIDKKGHKYNASLNNRNKGSGCPYCSIPAKKVCVDNCLLTLRPDLVKEWDYDKNKKLGLTPFNVSVGSAKKIRWICKKCKQSYASTITNRSQGHQCPYCHGSKTCRSNSLSTLNPKLAKEWHPTKNGKLTPNDVTTHSGASIWWIDKKGHEWQAQVNSRSNGSGCPKCNGIELKIGVVCDSLPEAYYYLELKNKNNEFKHHIKIGLGACVCDFYIPDINRYIEVTSFTKNSHHWATYHKNILRKKKYITKVLKAKFEFVQLKLTPKQIQYVRENSI